MSANKTGRRLSKQSLNGFINYGIVILAYLVVQLMISQGLMSNSLQSLLVPVCCYVVMAVSLNLVVGVSGELSLGHAGFMSLGAFSGIIVSVTLQSVIELAPLRLFLSMVVGAVIGGIGGVIVGVPVLRLRGDYLAIVTLAFGEIIKNIIMVLYVGVDEDGLHFATSEAALNLSEAGTAIVKGPMGAVGVVKASTFTAGILLVLLTLLIVQNMVNSRAGRAILALRDNRIAAESVGISVTKYKLMAFVTSAALAGAAGALFGLNYSSVSAAQFDFNTSILVLVYVVLGGLGNMWGSIIATVVLYVLPEALRQFSDYRMLVYAIVLILVMLATHNPILRSFFTRLFRREKEDGPAVRAVKGGGSHE